MIKLFENIKKLFTTEGYFKYSNYQILSTFDKIAYDINENKFLDYENEFSSLSIWNEISKNEFDKLYKNNICNCEVGTGTDIQSGNRYSLEEEVNKKYSDYYIEHDGNRDYYLYINNCLDRKLYFYVSDSFYKKACLKCGTCLNEIDSLYKRFDEIIYNEITKPKMINDICDK